MKSINNIQLFEQENDFLQDYKRISSNFQKHFPELSYIKLFQKQVELHPNNIALVEGADRLSYAQVLDKVRRFGFALRGLGLPVNARIGFLLPRSSELVIGAVASIKEKMTYVPIDINHPYLLKKNMIEQAEISCLICSSQQFPGALELLWECPHLKNLICVDTDEIWKIEEAFSERMNKELWDSVGEAAFDEISGGGWKSIYTGEWLSSQYIQEYKDNILEKMTPLLNKDKHVLEIGCGSGISTLAIAPLVSKITASDLSDTILDYAKNRAIQAEVDNITFVNGSTDQLHLFDDDYDVIMMNSVVQSFHGYIYLKNILDELISKLKNEGSIFLGNIWDAERKDEYYSSVKAYHKQHNMTEEVIAGDMFFTHKSFFEYLEKEIPEIEEISFSDMKGSKENELCNFSYDVTIKINKTCTHVRNKSEYTIHGKEIICRLPTEYKEFEIDTTNHEAYIIFTSGSTGIPKGVAVTEKSLLNLLHWFRKFCDMNQESNLLHTVSSGFDASIKNMLTPFITGARLVLFPDNRIDPAELLDIIQYEEISIINPGVPSILYPVMELAEELDYKELISLRFLALGGASPSMVKMRGFLLSTNCNCQIANIYGPTECTDIALAKIIDPDEWNSDECPPIGFPISNNYFYIMDSNGNIVPDGIPGELCLGGTGVSNGYVNNPDLTRESFIPDPLQPESIIYKTGDLAVYHKELGVFYRGRIDSQVKIRGHRIELSAIENQCLTLNDISEAAASVQRLNDRENLTLHVVIQSEINTDLIIKKLQSILPEYMIPDTVVIEDTLPKHVNGKINRKALKIPENVINRDQIIQPVNSTEKSLLEIWKKLFRKKNISTTDSFFDLGGHSLLAASLLTKIKRELQIHFPLSLLYKLDTIRKQSKWIKQRESNVSLIPFSLGEKTLVAFPPISGNGMVFQPLAMTLNNMFFASADFVNHDQLVKAYTDDIVSLKREKPISVLGYSAGCIIAYLVTAELESRGTIVDNLILVDGLPPEEIKYSRNESKQIAELTVNENFSSLDKSERDELYDLIYSYCLWISAQKRDYIVNAKLHFLSSNQTSFNKAETWSKLSTKEMIMYKGTSNHTDMFKKGNISEIAKILENIMN